MKLLTLFLLCATLLHADARQVLDSNERAAEPWFCHDLDCPEFKVLNTTDKYEIREYEAGTWVLTTVEARAYSVGVTEGFKRLFDYISGKNEDDRKIAMTSPVATLIVPGEGIFGKSKYTVTFFVPFKYQKNPPKPTDPKVIISKISKCKAAVLQYGGFVFDEWRINNKAKTLKSLLDKDGVSYEDSYYFSVGYDPPTRLLHRHNELWITIPDSEVVAS